jgi:hypothetical protein
MFRATLARFLTMHARTPLCISPVSTRRTLECADARPAARLGDKGDQPHFDGVAIMRRVLCRPGPGGSDGSARVRARHAAGSSYPHKWHGVLYALVGRAPVSFCRTARKNGADDAIDRGCRFRPVALRSHQDMQCKHAGVRGSTALGSKNWKTHCQHDDIP